jgi:hypothetical protein
MLRQPLPAQQQNYGYKACYDKIESQPLALFPNKKCGEKIGGNCPHQIVIIQASLVVGAKPHEQKKKP